MNDATHFIEVYKSRFSKTLINDEVFKINKLQIHLDATIKSNCETIAIFKIKFKNK